MIGNGYWATGITVRYGYSGMGLYGWQAVIDFFDDGFAGDDRAGRVSTEGRLKTRYMVREGDGAEDDALTTAVDTVKADAERLGIRFNMAVTPRVFYERDGDSDDYPPPDGWRGMINAQAERLGWRPVYRSEGAGT